MTRSPTTTTNFAAELQRIDDFNAGWMTAEAIEQRRAAALARHAEYDVRFDHAVLAVKALPERNREFARRIMLQLDTDECPSGSSNYHTAHHALVEIGISEPWRLFTHDLRFLATLLDKQS